MNIDIRAIRQKLKMTQKALADKLGVSRATVNAWENEKARPSQLAKRQIARLFNGKE